MGADRLIYVKVLYTTERWYGVSAVTKEEAMKEVEKLPGVIRALEADYEEPGENYFYV